MQSLTDAKEAFGAESVQAIHSMIAVAVAQTGVGELEAAETILTQTNWVLVKSKQTDPLVKSQLHRALGRLYDAKGDVQSALQHFSQDVRVVWCMCLCGVWCMCLCYCMCVCVCFFVFVVFFSLP